jgi:2-polyprenyl-6-methoxyphenol hydroxylase-like FAD-dependent oxidoreductase
MPATLKVGCCIAGGGPAGMMLGYLLGRAGIDTLVMEKHRDFLRDFRGDTVHPSTLRILSELGLLEEFLKLPHSQLQSLGLELGRQSFKIADFGRLKPPGNFIALMPQWDFLNFLAVKGRRFESLKVMMSTEVKELIEESGRVTGVRALSPDGPIEIRADLVVACDGRSSTLRALSGLPVREFGVPIDVLWFRMSKKPTDPVEILGHLDVDKMVVTIDRGDYWQCAYVIPKGALDGIKARGLDEFRAAVVDGARFLADRTDEIHSFDDLKLLSVSVNRLDHWSRPGLLCIGDAAHAMSPIGGVGINLAIQDAVATANLLAARLKDKTLQDSDLTQVERRRLMPVKAIQAMQVTMQDRVLKPVTSGGVRKLKVPMLVHLLNSSGWLRRWPAQILGVGLRPEHVRSPVG